jgi:3-oxoacyl-[acyl-carrier protein] reductase
MDWNGQVAVVTGGSRGIGAAICRRLAKRGAAVGINYVARSTEADALRGEIVAAGGRAALLQADVALADAKILRIDFHLHPFDGARPSAPTRASKPETTSKSSSSMPLWRSRWNVP